ncbi:MAG: 6-phosphogluconolactonase [Candidatus Solibacter usitatus]|nr:6-phosphogluconolactonase [Candidatus Solibacter usitatus]
MRVFPGPEEAARGCAAEIAGWLREAVRERGRASLAVSGGSTPKLMFEELAGAEVDWRRVDLFWVDERAVGPEEAESNYGMTRRCLIEPAGIPEANVHRMMGEWDAVEAAAAYTEELREYFGEAIPRFDVVVCGMGEDGHTASLFPGEGLVEDRRGVCAGLWVTKKQQWRITLLAGVMLGARRLCVLACGAGKAAAMERVWREEGPAVDVPARLLRGGEWFVDEAAVNYEEIR